MIKKIFKLFDNIVLYFFCTIVIALIGKAIYGVDESNTILCPDSYVYFLIIFPFVIIFLWNRRRQIKEFLVSKLSTSKQSLPPVEPFTVFCADTQAAVAASFSESAEKLESPVFTDVSPSSAHSILSRVDAMEGHDFEHWAADLLRKNGFSNVSVTPASGDHGVDVLAQKDGIKYAIQCKRYNHDLGNTPVQEVHAGKQMYGCQIGVVLTNQHFTSGAKQLADATGVLLWDRDWLLQHISGFSDPAPVVRNSDNLLYSQAARLIDKMEAEGIVGPFQGSKPRNVLK